LKKEDLLKVFPSLNEMEIQTLPNELVICWYPSSGVGADLNDNFCGYVALRHWQEQPSKLKPNFFIFSDILEFELPLDYELIFSIELNIEKIKGGDLLEEKFTFDGTLLEGCDEIFLGDQFRTNKEVLTLKRLVLLKKNGLFLLLVQAENEYVYSSFIQEKIQIPLLTINRPWDPFVRDNGIEIEKLGIQEFIAGYSYVSCLIFGEEFKKYPDFVFQTLRNEYTSNEDLANLYSRNNIN
jgi:hypothetical protein